ncbi:MAG: hypothetical protein Q7R87_04750 [Nanoarchaeota archaeon]|nr:hypothetical protein [Nanoarchaeota archaeon]
MVMNKRGAAEDTDMLKVLGGIILLVLAVGIIFYAINSVGESSSAVVNQLPDDISAIAVACKSLAESGVGVLSSPYCLQAREVTYSSGLFGLSKNKEVVTCNYALDVKKWFNLEQGKVAPDCGINAANNWAVGYCETLKSTQGAKYNGETIVNGKRCGIGASNWGVTLPDPLA